MKVISIGTDRNVFVPGSAVRSRIIEYGALFDELHIVVFSKKKLQHMPEHIAPNIWLYPTNSFTKFSYIRDAIALCNACIRDRVCTPSDTVVTCQDPFETGLVGLRVKKRHHVPLHIQIHTDFLSPFFKRSHLLNRIRVRIARRVLGGASAVRVVSERIQKSLQSRGFVMPEAHVLPIFVDTKIIESSPITTDLQKKYPQFNFIILLASRLTKEKNISLALEVLARLISTYPRIGMVIVGTGPQSHALQREVAQRKLSRNVVFEPWQQNLASYYKTAHLFLLTSDYEGYGMTIVEALSAGCPVISTDVGIASNVLSRENSYVCPPRDVTCLVEHIQIYIERNDVREVVVQEAKEKLSHVTYPSKEAYLRAYQASLESSRYI